MLLPYLALRIFLSEDEVWGMARLWTFFKTKSMSACIGELLWFVPDRKKLFSPLSVWWAVSPHLPSMSPCVLQCASKTVFPLCDFDMRFLPDSDGLRFLRGSVRTCQKGCRIPHCTSKNMIHFGARIPCFSWKLLDAVGKISLTRKVATFKYIRCLYSLPPPHPLPKLVRSNQI